PLTTLLLLLAFSLFCSLIQPPPTPTLFPSTTLFRSPIQLTPNFILANQLGLRGSLWGLVVFYIAGGQAFAIYIEHHQPPQRPAQDRKSTRLNSSHVKISYAVFCLKKKIQSIIP